MVDGEGEDEALQMSAVRSAHAAPRASRTAHRKRPRRRRPSAFFNDGAEQSVGGLTGGILPSALKGARITILEGSL
jgi:hypothetical protein